VKLHPCARGQMDTSQVNPQRVRLETFNAK
jgi:hypothetical protein